MLEPIEPKGRRELEPIEPKGRRQKSVLHGEPTSHSGHTQTHATHKHVRMELGLLGCWDPGTQEVKDFSIFQFFNLKS